MARKRGETDARGRLESDPFDYRETKAGELMISRGGRVVVTLGGKRAERGFAAAARPVRDVVEMRIGDDRDPVHRRHPFAPPARPGSDRLCGETPESIRPIQSAARRAASTSMGFGVSNHSSRRSSRLSLT